MNKNMDKYTLISAEFSYYSGKTRSYLLHKRIPSREVIPNGWHWAHTIPRKVGAAVVPVVITPEGEWLQDTSVIMDRLEARFPAAPALPETPVLRFAAYLFELWGDEFLLPLAMHTRWSRPEHFPRYVDEVGPILLPGWPKWIQQLLGGRLASRLKGLAPSLGFDQAMAPLLDRFGAAQLDALDTHFAGHRFLFGDRPSYGDYGLIGPLYAHIGRDPLSRRDLIDTRPNLQAWIGRMFDPASSAMGKFQREDVPAATLLPALRSIFDEMVPFLQASGDVLGQSPVLDAKAKHPPRFIGTVQYPMAGGTHRRAAVPYAVWMAQRLLRVYHGMSPAERAQVHGWLGQVGGEAVLALNLPPMRRSALTAMHVSPLHAD